MKIATLGPQGTFSHEAVLKYDKDAQVTFTDTIWDVFEKVTCGEVDQGIVPVENSISGNVGITFNALLKYRLKIYAEILIPVRHFLASNSKHITHLYAHPETFAQCQGYINAHLPRVEHLPTSSNAKSAEKLAKNQRKTTGAIVPFLALNNYHLSCLAEDIQDNPNNTTRFFVLAKSSQKMTGKDRTSIALAVKHDHPGLLHSLTGIFSKFNINLTKIDSLPSKGKLGQYIFFIELQGHQDDENIQKVFAEIEKSFKLHVLGSYPRKY